MNKLIYSYPDENDMDAREVQEMMYKRLEFSELETDAEPKRITPGEYFPYQELGRRYMFPYDRMLCIMEPGTGKTCYNIAIAEKVRMIHNWVDTTITIRSNIKRCYVLTSSDLLVSEFNYQFICRCTDGRYMSDKIRSAQKSTGRSLQVNKIVKEFYDVMSYFDFNRMIKGLSDAQIIERFSDCMFFLDEVHTFRNSDTRSQRDTSIAYTNIHNLLHVSQRIKVVLNTATPMMDNMNEIIPLINMIVSLDEQLDESEGVENLSFEQLASLMKGRVVFVRARPFKLNIIENGIGLRVPTEQIVGQDTSLADEVEVKVVPVLLSEFQSEAYYENFGSRQYTDNSYLNTIQKAFFYSDDEELNRVRDGAGQSSMVVNEGFREVLDQLEDFSAKAHQLLDMINSETGIHFVYWNYLEGGLNILAALLLTEGLERFSGMVSPYEREVGRGSRSTTSVMSEYCVSTNEDGENQFTEFSSAFPRRMRFAILSGTNKPVHSRLIKEVMVHPDNIDGDYIKVLIASPVAKLGINLSNVKQIHILGPMWNLGNMIQAEYRSIRSESHTDLYNRLMRRKREKMISGEPLTEEEENEVVNIYINRYCAIPRYLDESYLNQLGYSYNDPTDELFDYMMTNMTNTDIIPHLNRSIPQLHQGVDIQHYPLSIDVYMYRRSVEKEIGIRELLRSMKRLAIDCNNNMARNRVVDGIEGSLVCDYQECDYTCLYDPTIEDPSGELKGSEQQSYGALYMHDILDKCRTIIERMLTTHGSISWSNLLSLVSERDGKLIIDHQVLQRLVGEYDQSHRIDTAGMPMYTLANQHGIWLSNYLSSHIDGDVVPNTQQYLEKMPLSLVISQLEQDQVLYTDQDIQDILDDVTSMTLARKLSILEKGILDQDERILELFSHYIFITPKRILRTYREGNRLVNESRVVPGEYEYIHMYPSETKSSYIVSTLFKNVPHPASKSRIYDTERRRWRNMNARDYDTYLESMERELAERISDIDSRDVLAYTNLIDYRLRLINYKQHAETMIEQGRNPDDIRGPFGPRGRLCFNWDIDLLAESLYDVDSLSFMRNIIGYIQSNPDIEDYVQNNLAAYIRDNQDLQPLVPLFTSIINAGQEFDWTMLPDRDLPGLDDPYDTLYELLRLQYYSLDNREHVRMKTIDWTVPQLAFVNLVLLTFASSAIICAQLDVEGIFDRAGLLYRM